MKICFHVHDPDMEKRLTELEARLNRIEKNPNPNDGSGDAAPIKKIRVRFKKKVAEAEGGKE